MQTGNPTPKKNAPQKIGIWLMVNPTSLQTTKKEFESSPILPKGPPLSIKNAIPKFNGKNELAFWYMDVPYKGKATRLTIFP
jgi:hypothetical protein